MTNLKYKSEIGKLRGFPRASAILFHHVNRCVTLVFLICVVFAWLVVRDGGDPVGWLFFVPLLFFIFIFRCFGGLIYSFFVNWR